METRNIMIVGVGGQGTLLTSRIIGKTALENGYDVKNLEKVIKESVNGDVLTVIIAKAPCALLKGQVFPDKYHCDIEKCKKCNMCLSIGCPAITKTVDGNILIDKTMCNGCGLCKNYCKFDAINKVEK